MADRTTRQQLEEGQAELKRVRAALAVEVSPGFLEHKAKAAEALRVAREAFVVVEREREQAAQQLQQLSSEVSALSVQVAAKQAQSSPGLIAWLATIFFVGLQIYVLAELLTMPRPPPEWVLPAVAPVPALLMGVLWRKRLSSKRR